MKTTLYLIFLIVSFAISAQSPIWVKNNAVWHYSINQGPEFLKIEYVRDTLLDNHLSKMFTTKLFRFYTYNMHDNLLDSNYIDTNYTWNNDDTIFYWNNNNFEILYDFSKSIGDSWSIGINGINDHGCSESSSVEITGESLLNLNGIDYKSLDLFSADSSYLKLRGNYNSRFGAYSNLNSAYSLLFPDTSFCDGSNENLSYNLTCFQDDELFYSNTNGECEILTYVGVNKLFNPNFKLFPNPSKGVFTIESPKSDFRITIYNSVGKICAEYYETGNRTTIDSKLEQGIYFIGVEFEGGGNGVMQKIIVE